jgi:membrane dipeptidase
VCSPGCFDYWSRLLALADARPDDARLSRRGFLAASAVPFVAAACATAAPSGPTRDLLDATLSFDLHSHPGLFKSTSNDTLAGHRQEAESGRVKLIALTATSDAPVIARDRNGALRPVREPKAGELYASMYRQIDALVRWSRAAGMPIVSSVTDAGAPGPPVRGILAVEGCDFLEGRIDRLGIVIDVAHARSEVVSGVVDTTTQPIILSHSNIMDSSGWVRFISPEHARLIAGTGGVIGAMPIILGRRSDDITGYVHHISRLVDAAGIDHVGIGTDMDGIGPSAIFTSYARWPSLAAALVDHGYRPEEAAKILGGNAQRVFRRVGASAAPRGGVSGGRRFDRRVPRASS